METDHSGDGVFRVVAHRIGAGDDVAVEDDGDTFVVGGGHLLGGEDDGTLLAIVDDFGGDDIVGVVADGQRSSLHLRGDVAVAIVSIVVVFTTGADQGKAAEEHQT